MNTEPEPKKRKEKVRPDPIVIRPRDLQVMLGLSRHGLGKIEALRPIKLGPRSVAYFKEDVDAFLAARRAERDAA